MSREERQRALWQRAAPTYDASIARLDGRFMAASRAWACERAAGAVLEVAIGTGLSLPHYPPDARVTGLDPSTAMLTEAERRASTEGMEVTLIVGEGDRLPFPAASFDAVVCAFALCGVPDVPRALDEMYRVVRPGGALLLVDHVGSGNPVIRAGQHLLDLVTVPTQGEHWTRRPLRTVRARGWDVVESGRLHHGIIERVHVRRPPA